MPRRPAVRKSDLDAALDAMLRRSLRPRKISCHADGSFTVDFDDQPAKGESDDLDDELDRWVASDGRG